MDILHNYKKKPKEPLKSATVKLPQEQIDALREYDINLGLLVRNMLDDSDMMRTYRQQHKINNKVTSAPKLKPPTSHDFHEDLFTFKHDGICFYYLNPTTMFEKSSDGAVMQIKKGRYYGAKKKHDKESNNA